MFLAYILRPTSLLRLSRFRHSFQPRTSITSRRPRPTIYTTACDNSKTPTKTTPKTVPYIGHGNQKQQTTATNDTIFALATGQVAAAGIAVMRISGPAATHALISLLKPSASGEKILPKPRTASLRTLHHPQTGDMLDQALVLHFPAPRSFTTEDVVELHIHGSRAVITAVTEALADVPAPILRPAGRGEFTRRAFENGAMDLIDVEALADLIAAETSSQRKQALKQLSGDTAQILGDWRERIVNALAHVEAVIDFADDVGDAPFAGVIPDMRMLRDEMERKMKQDRRAEIVRTGARIVIVGPPNAGKSSLLNAFAKRPAAIVSATAGTTRDVLDVRMDLSGLAVTVSDTAGLRDCTDDDIEVEGMRRARVAASDADVILCLHDASSEQDMTTDLEITSEDEDDQDEDAIGKAHIIYVVTKTDLRREYENSGNKMKGVQSQDVFETSVLQNKGISELLIHVEAVLKQRLQTSDNDTETTPVMTRARHRHHVERAVHGLSSFITGQEADRVEQRMPMDLAAEDLRISCKEVGQITGVIDMEEVLDVVFSEFCIGK